MGSRTFCALASAALLLATITLLPHRAGSQDQAAPSHDILSVLKQAATTDAAPALGKWQARALLEPVEQAIVSAQLDAQIEHLPLKDGDPFSAGDLLARFDCALHEAELAAAKAERNSALKTLENSRRLAALNSIGELEVQLAEDALAKAVAKQRSARIIVDRCTIRAPYDGRVVETLVHQHESVKRGQELLSILDDSALEVRIVVPSTWLLWLKPGTHFALAVDETGLVRTGSVNVIGARIDPVSQTIKLRGLLDGPPAGLLAGMSGTATFKAPVPTE